MLAGSQTSPWAASWQTEFDVRGVHAQDGGHCAHAHGNGFLHVLAAIAHCADRLGKTERPGRDVSGVFAQTVSRDIAGLGHMRLEHPQ